MIFSVTTIMIITTLITIIELVIICFSKNAFLNQPLYWAKPTKIIAIMKQILLTKKFCSVNQIFFYPYINHIPSLNQQKFCCDSSKYLSSVLGVEPLPRLLIFHCRENILVMVLMKYSAMFHYNIFIRLF